MAGMSKVIKLSIHLTAKGEGVAWLDDLRVGLDALPDEHPRTIARLNVPKDASPSLILRALADEYDRQRPAAGPSPA